MKTSNTFLVPKIVKHAGFTKQQEKKLYIINTIKLCQQQTVPTTNLHKANPSIISKHKVVSVWVWFKKKINDTFHLPNSFN